MHETHRLLQAGCPLWMKDVSWNEPEQWRWISRAAAAAAAAPVPPETLGCDPVVSAGAVLRPCTAHGWSTGQALPLDGFGVLDLGSLSFFIHKMRMMLPDFWVCCDGWKSGFDDLQVCADPGVPENGFRTPSSGVFFESSVTRFHCQDGFKLKGSTKRLCMKHLNGTLGWVPSDKPVCVQEDCRIPQIEDAEIHNKTYRHGDKLIIMCHEGFKIRYPDLYNVVSLCRDDGTWDNLPICQGCLRPLASSNGYVNISEFQTSFPVGTVISYHCFPGFKLEGSEYLECLHNLIWSSSPPRCLALEVCPLPPMVSHGDFVCHPRPCERYNHGTVVEFYCDPGYSLTSDYKYITCQYGEWFPSYQVYCIKSEQTWPGTHETLLTTWKIVAFTATSVLLVLLLVILARMFQTKFKAHFPPRGPPRSSSSDPDFVVVDGVPVMLPSYDEAVSGGLSALGPGYLASVGQGCPLPVDDQSPPAYPGSGDTDTGPGESETCDSVSGSEELLQSLYSPPSCQGGSRSTSDSPDTIPSTAGEVASTSPGIDIADGYVCQLEIKMSVPVTRKGRSQLMRSL
ncbi:sushi domain-containing protein 4 isoform X3 [Camelus ferus]|uniref:Sushi domain-containing protein 4 n=1 Tax=Camelus ferus TaxID=419612 RepID=A0A8B8RYG1_CAMFR|nr:sushi domain-containing protein 4 isoform X3 [Camelus dromedarius]XP_032322522.1 sushi domain-containing protein 4 isoform X3 [Camelus ferus]